MVFLIKRRMHSSRMRTGRSLTVCCSVLPGGGLPGPEGGVLLGPGGVLLGPGGGSAWSRGGSPETPPVNRITDTCKNITLATISLRPVINVHLFCAFWSGGLEEFRMHQPLPDASHKNKTTKMSVVTANCCNKLDQILPKFKANFKEKKTTMF